MTNDDTPLPSARAFTLPGGPTHALMLHGFMGTPGEMRPLADALASAGVTVRAPLLPGFGPDLERLRSITLDDWLRSAGDAWRETRHDARRTVLVGFSMGGALATALAATDPPDQLVLLAPHWRIADPRAIVLPILKHVKQEFQIFADADFSDPGVRRALAEANPGADLDDPDVQERFRQEATIPTSALDELRRAGVLAAKRAAQVRVPTLVVQGRDDQTSLPRHTRRLASRLGGNVTLEEVAGDHLLVDRSHPAWPAVHDLVTGAAVPIGATP